MDYLGLLSLGAFVGTIAALGIRYIKDLDQWQKVLAAILPAVLSGAALAFVDRFKFSPAMGCYPFGIVVALMWTYADIGVENLANGKNKSTKAIGFLHLAAAALVTLGSAILVLVPAIAQVNAEAAIPANDRLAILLEERKNRSLLRRGSEMLGKIRPNLRPSSPFKSSRQSSWFSHRSEVLTSVSPDSRIYLLGRQRIGLLSVGELTGN